MVRLDDPTGRDADFDWCLAFGEGGARKEAQPSEELQLPHAACVWPAAGYTCAPRGHRLYTDKRLADWGPSEWENQAKWEALGWEERRGDTSRQVTVRLPKDDGFVRMMTQYMQTPWQCPVHTLKLALMKVGLDVEERMNDTYDVLFLLVRGDDEVLEAAAGQGQRLAEADSSAITWKRTLVREPEPFELESFKDKVENMGRGCGSRCNPCRDEYLAADLYNITTRPALDHDGGAWGVSMGAVPYDPGMKNCFEDRALNDHLYTARPEYDNSYANYKKFPHPRYFHSGERQVLVKAIMESVEWARYLPTSVGSGADASKVNMVYPNVQLTPHAQETSCLVQTVAFGYPTEVTGSRRNQQMLGNMSFLRSTESPMYSVHAYMADGITEPWNGEVPSIAQMVCGSGGDAQVQESEGQRGSPLRSWRDLDNDDKRRSGNEMHTCRRRLTIYPFMVDQCERLADKRGAKVRNTPDDTLDGVQNQQYALLRKDDRFELHHFKNDPFEACDFGSLKEFKEHDFRKTHIAGDIECPDKVREQQTFLVDCFPLHCPYERDYLRAEFAAMKKCCSADVLSLPLDRIEGYFGSGAALYFAWLRCYTKALVIPGFLGLILQLVVWSGTAFPGSVNVLQGWLIAYCMFCALWGSCFMLNWKRRQAQLQYRWGLDNVEDNAQPRKEFLEKLVLTNEDQVPGQGAGCLRAVWSCDQPVELTSPNGQVEVVYSSIVMHYARSIVAILFLAVGTFVVVFTTLGILLMRARGMNAVTGSASAWTTLSYVEDQFVQTGNVNDVYVNFWTVYDNSCLSLSDCTTVASDESISSGEELVYGFAASRTNTSDGELEAQYTWRTSDEVIVRKVPKIVDYKALLVSGAAVRDVLLPVCDGSTTNQVGLEQLCCTAADLADLEQSVRCWTEGKQEFADRLAREESVEMFVQVDELDVATLERRVQDDMNFYFTHSWLEDCEEDLEVCSDSLDCTSCLYTYTSPSSGETVSEVFTSKRSTNGLAALPYAMIQGRQSDSELELGSLSAAQRDLAQKVFAREEDHPFQDTIEKGNCEALQTSNVRVPLREQGVNSFSDTVGPQPLGHACRFGDHSSLKDYLGSDDMWGSYDAGISEAYSFVEAVDPHPTLPRRVPLYEPACSDLEALVRDSRAELEQLDADRNVRIRTKEVEMYPGSGEDYWGESATHRVTVWEAYDTFQPYFKTTVALFSHEDDDGVQCHVYDADQVANECGDASLTTRAECEANGEEWRGVMSNSDEVAASLGDDESSHQAESALYKRAPDSTWGNAQVWGSTVISVVACQIYGALWDVVATRLNNWENHRTQIEYEDAMIFKQFVFQFINYYFLLLYIAFLKVGAPFAPFLGKTAAAFTGSFALPESVQTTVVGLADLGEVPIVSLRDTCSLNEDQMPDCMSELCMQLITLFIIKAAALQVLESLMPTITRCSQKLHLPEVDGKPGADSSQPDHRGHAAWIYSQYRLPKFGDNSVGGSFQDFNEMAIQFGFMSLFAVGFPGAAFFALANNIQEMRADGYKLVRQFQRSPIELRQDIGAWEAVLSFISCVPLELNMPHRSLPRSFIDLTCRYISVVTNAVILAFTSKVIYESRYPDGIEPIARRYLKYDLWIGVAITEHAIILIKALIATMAREEPANIVEAKRNQQLELKEILFEKRMEQVASGRLDSLISPRQRRAVSVLSVPHKDEKRVQSDNNQELVPPTVRP